MKDLTHNSDYKMIIEKMKKYVKITRQKNDERGGIILGQTDANAPVYFALNKNENGCSVRIFAHGAVFAFNS